MQELLTLLSAHASCQASKLRSAKRSRIKYMQAYEVVRTPSSHNKVPMTRIDDILPGGGWIHMHKGSPQQQLRNCQSWETKQLEFLLSRLQDKTHATICGCITGSQACYLHACMCLLFTWALHDTINREVTIVSAICPTMIGFFQ